MIRCMMLVLMMLSMDNVFGKSIKQSETYKTPVTLQDYIQSNCNKQCVGQEDLLKSVSDTARELDIDFKDLLSIVKVESKFKPKATSKGNKGLMQVNIRYHRNKLKGRNVFNVQTNIEVGGKIYKDCLGKFDGNRSKALKCYNGGGDKKYVIKINKARDEIDKLIDLERKEDDGEYPVIVFNASEKENLMSVETTDAGKELTDDQLKAIVDGWGDQVKGLIVKPYANGKILDENKLLAINEVRERTYLWAILILRTDNSTGWLVGSHYNKEEAESHIQRILAVK